MEETRFHMATETLQALPLGEFSGTIHLVDRPEAVEPALRHLRHETLLGFDSETKPNFKKGRSNPIALVQIASEKHAVLLRLGSVGMPVALRSLLENDRILKIAQEPLDELLKLKETYQVNARGFINLGVISKELACKPRSVKGLAALFLGFRISKSAQTSNWENTRLTSKQLIYAATDAWVCRQIYLEMRKRKLLEGLDARLPDELSKPKPVRRRKRRYRIERAREQE